jgi:hypothetical protein
MKLEFSIEVEVKSRGYILASPPSIINCLVVQKREQYATGVVIRKF